MPGKARTTATREALLRGAIECLRTKGFAKTTARDVVAAAGVNLGAIGYHYGSMDALLAEAIGQVFREWLFRVRPALAADEAASFEDVLLGVAREASAIFPDGRGHASAFLEAVAYADRSPDVASRMAEDFESLRAISVGMIESAVGDRVAPDERRGLASIFIALDVGLTVQALLDPDRAPTAEEIVESLAVLARLFDGPNPKRPSRRRARQSA